MALNLWKVAGKATSFNPLPTGFVTTNYVTLNYGTYTVNFRAKSPSGAQLWLVDNGIVNVNTTYTLTSNFQIYTLTFTVNRTSAYNLNFNDLNSKGDIVIDSINLVQAPLPKLTINGVDGFLSGKWIFAQPEFTVISDQTLQLDATANYRTAYVRVPVLAGQIITASLDISSTYGSYIQLTPMDVNNATIGSAQAANAGGSISYTMPVNTVKVDVSLSNNQGAKRYLFVKPMLNLGSTPAPYSLKTGDKMVLPAPKKNLYSGYYGTRWGTTVTQISTNEYQVTTAGNNPDEGISFLLPQIFGKQLTFSLDVKGSGIPLRLSQEEQNVGPFGSSFNISQTDVYSRFSNTFTSKIGYANQTNLMSIFISTSTKTAGTFYVRFPQIEYGTIATPYQPYILQLNKLPSRVNSANTGLRFNGSTDYLQLPSMTMDSIEVDLYVDSSNPSYSTILDARTGASNSQLYNQAQQGGWNNIYIDGVLQSSSWTALTGRHKVKAVMNTPFTDDVTLMSLNSQSNKLKGILYKVTCYLNGGIVAQYDFTNPNNIVGNTVLTSPAPQNLIPSFEDPRWSIHPNAKVMGKDVLHLDGNGMNISSVDIPSLPNTVYLDYITLSDQTNCIVKLSYLKVDKTWISDLWQRTGTLTTPANTAFIRYQLYNNINGSFDFIKPQLYQLDGKQGTMNGSPVQAMKPSKRLLYNKR